MLNFSKHARVKRIFSKEQTIACNRYLISNTGETAYRFKISFTLKAKLQSRSTITGKICTFDVAKNNMPLSSSTVLFLLLFTVCGSLQQVILGRRATVFDCSMCMFILDWPPPVALTIYLPSQLQKAWFSSVERRCNALRVATRHEDRNSKMTYILSLGIVATRSPNLSRDWGPIRAISRS